jgi:hypothetical protein
MRVCSSCAVGLRGQPGGLRPPVPTLTLLLSLAPQARKHVVAMNAELDATLGPLLKRLADAQGVVFTNRCVAVVTEASTAPVFA